MNPLSIRIVGGSLAGLFAGILLGRDGHDVKIYERSSTGFAGRGAGLVPQQEVFRMLREIGVEHLATFGVLSTDRIYLDKSGALRQRMHMPQTQISWDLLYSAVVAKLGTDKYMLSKPVRSVHEEPGHSVILFEDGSTEAADLVIGADGLGSVVRSAINANANSRYAGYVAWRGLVPELALTPAASPLPGNFTFYIADGNHALGYLVPGPGGEIAKGERRYNWVWYRFVQEEDLRDTFTGQTGRSSRFSLARGELSDTRRERLRQDAARFLPRSSRPRLRRKQRLPSRGSSTLRQIGWAAHQPR
ncbi:FAD-dependent monooxygenase [Brucella sp. NM4]|uniref:FAD binding domain-containing protein n=1 Tax=Brucella sp. NM4 TaxID=3045175 RepID=UPI0032D9F939